MRRRGSPFGIRRVCVPCTLGDPVNPLAYSIMQIAPPKFVRRGGISSGKQGTRETLKRMRDWWTSDAPYLRKFVGLLLSGHIDGRACAVKDYLCEARKIFDWFQGNVRWTRDIRGAETLQRPLMTVSQGFGDCDCITSALNAAYNSVGYETMAVAGDLREDTREYSHVWSRVNLPGFGWVGVDASDPRTQFGWESPRGTKRMTIDDNGHIDEHPL